MNLIRNLFWFAVFLAATFAFTVLFEHGPTNFGNNAKKEMDGLTKMINTKIEKPKDDSDKLGH
ncbi:MAG TPA: hypothetical protein VFD27_06415 [Chthoniobacteraceae bacterium]|jgi:hypothetical protein|nr:hypothetical protein [Chthoniobacteraceae bacterium]